MARTCEILQFRAYRRWVFAKGVRMVAGQRGRRVSPDHDEPGVTIPRRVTWKRIAIVWGGAVAIVTVLGSTALEIAHISSAVSRSYQSVIDHQADTDDKIAKATGDLAAFQVKRDVARNEYLQTLNGTLHEMNASIGNVKDRLANIEGQLAVSGPTRHADARQ